MSGAVKPVDAYTDADEAMMEKTRVDAEIGKLKARLRLARSEAKVTGKYADRLWYAKQSEKLNLYQHRSQALQVRMGQLGRRRVERYDKAFNTAMKRAIIERYGVPGWEALVADAVTILEAKGITPETAK